MAPHGFRMYNGSCWFKVDKKGRDFVVETPSLICGVRGTQFLVTVEDPKTARVDVFEGEVAVSDTQKRKTVSVFAGQTTTTTPHGLPSTPVRFDPRSLDNWWEQGKTTPSPVNNPGPVENPVDIDPMPPVDIDPMPPVDVDPMPPVQVDTGLPVGFNPMPPADLRVVG